MLSYNTQLKPLKLPEYGRNIQRMIDHCLTIEDREERTRCAYSIINSMSHLFPNLANSEEYSHKLWDHLAIMSDFKLDIDYPCEIVKPEDFASKPTPIPLPKDENRFRHYGKYIIEMIGKACELEPGDERQALVMLIANQMKKTIVSQTAEGIEDIRIFKDMEMLSHGEIKLDPATTRLHDFQMLAPVKTGKKKKKK